MRPNTRISLAGLLAGGALIAMAFVPLDDDGDTGTAPPGGPYIALGDSYTAGPGIPEEKGSPAGCDRSDHNYPALVADRLGLKAADFRDVSCSGATIADLGARQTTDQGANPAQFSALSERTRLVTLGIGGNDIGFGSMIKRCVGAGMLYKALGSGKYVPEDAPCERQYVSDGTDEVREKIDAVGVHLAESLAEIARRAPHARVYVIGYPEILPSTGGDCLRTMSLAPGDVAFLHQKERQLNDELRDRAEAASAEYVDTFTPSRGRGACAAEDVRWIEPLEPVAPAAPVHPNARGERGMADAVLRAFEK
ncbi:SGNH/GDSL hydrolase family protein [Streptomyces sp. S3(2020)]|uniref:SGNH/GDSL hydrolase family protein n=1 Tax=Streptomyces sp. S3(2020) TaxID=2732044 RepID=UPI001487AAB8|nr:SGNH/GDSL hydrolase family protein [Streptomyces sp. S3(2020)]NNN35327.1 SGNH/GDSL hydrolase family protein [Streptomyces sp. S3(2020)]